MSEHIIEEYSVLEIFDKYILILKTKQKVIFTIKLILIFKI